jgi:hypothetical protein
MKRAVFAAVILLSTLGAFADETRIDSKIDSIGLFKNGLAVVQRSVAVDGPGVYRLEDVPSPVHGTFWIESDAPVEAQVTMRQVESPLRSKSPIDFQQDLVGQNVVIELRGDKAITINGTVVALAPSKGDEAWDRTYQQPQYGYYANAYNYNGNAAGPANYLIVEDGGKRTYVDSSLIATVQVQGGGTVTHRQPVLLLTVGGDKKPAVIHINYLAKGFAWAPSYRVRLLDDKTLSLEQQAVLKNEMEDVTDAEVSLISGYPSIQFANVISPLSLTQNWTDFFAQLAQGESDETSSGNRSVVGNQRIMANGPPSDGGPDLPAVPAGDGPDVHYQSIGRRSLAEGDSLMLPVASATTSYDRIVQWIVRDNRDAQGRIQGYSPYDNSPVPADSAWDAVRFKNAFPFPMTTAPAMVEDKGRFAGQRLSYWVNVGDQTTLQITKALSIVTRAEEHEDAAEDRKVVYIGGTEYRKVSVEGDLIISNHRDRAVDVVIRRQFSGELKSADENPQQELREEGVYSVNRRNQLTWNISLKPGEEKTLHYSYTVLVG